MRNLYFFDLFKMSVANRVQLNRYSNHFELMKGLWFKTKQEVINYVTCLLVVYGKVIGGEKISNSEVDNGM